MFVPKHSLSVGLVTSLAANNSELQTNLVKNGVIWSLLLFLFEYDFTLDESGVQAEEKSNQQKSANNLARMSILSIVALCGYELKLIIDENDPLNAAIRYNAATSPASVTSTGSPAKEPLAAHPSSSSSPLYTSNATNLIQNNAIHAVQMTNNGNSNRNLAAGGVEKISDGEEVFESDQTIKVEKENFASSRKYTVGGGPTNIFVKKIVDRLLTKNITDKFASHSDSEVLKLLTSNTRNPYIIWDNATRSQLIDFLDSQRSKSTKEQNKDITEILEDVCDFTFDAHR